MGTIVRSKGPPSIVSHHMNVKLGRAEEGPPMIRKKSDGRGNFEGVLCRRNRLSYATP